LTPAATPVPSGRDTIARRSRGVLVVDDDRDIRETLQEILESEGYEVHTARNGADALDQLRAELPQLILLDLFMPVMDGTEFRRRQLEDPQLADIPVVVVSAAAGLADRVNGLRVAAYLEKPLQLDELFSLVSRFCQTRH
jgi:CheY-like chemotaxis protein